MGDVLENYLICIFVLFGVIIITAYLIGLMNNLFIKNTGKIGVKLHYITAVIGTPIHELGHLTMNIIFLHKVDEYKLLQFNSKDGQLGYVKYRYNPKSIYQQIGNFFTALGPIICGAFVLYVLMYFLANDQYNMIIVEAKNALNQYSELSTSNLFSTLSNYMIEVFKVFFSIDFILSPNFFLFTILSFSVAFHMDLSNADIKNGIKGGAYFLFIAISSGIVIGLISSELLSEINEVILAITYNVMIFFTFILVISLIMTLLGFVYRFIINLIKSLA